LNPPLLRLPDDPVRGRENVVPLELPPLFPNVIRPHPPPGPP
jgi:hypothetical protein